MIALLTACNAVLVVLNTIMAVRLWKRRANPVQMGIILAVDTLYIVLDHFVITHGGWGIVAWG